MGMEPGHLTAVGHSQGHGHAIMAWKIVMIKPRGRRPDNDLDDVNAAFSRIYHSNGLGQVSET
jgi:hypothetical protein